jgi:transposase-like protein
MIRHNRRHSLEFKKRIVREIECGARSEAETCRDEHLARSLVERWINQSREGNLRDHSTTRERQLEKELDRYKKKVGELVLENEALKKIDEFLASTKRSNGLIVTERNLGLRKDVQS